jgi:cysteinyl-tRNA synthetase
MSNDQIESLIRIRDEARANKNWTKADDIRDRLQELNIVLEDGAPGATGWRKG